MKTSDIRKKYLNYFESKNHKVVPSSAIVPENDPTTLFTGSGMQPMVPYLLGEEHPAGNRVTDSQKCFRAQDIEEVGDNRHTTFFEMLGNWSFGDYFKEEQIQWMFEFLTKELGLNPDNLYITAFRGNESLNIPRDEEAAKIWQEQFAGMGMEAKVVENAEENGMQDGRIFYYDEKKNWWSRVGIPKNMGEGEPGGPDTEMFWDFGEDLGLHEKSEWKDSPCHVNCDCGRFLEIGNNVFMQYKKVEDGFEELPQKNVDFGGGLERIAAALNNDPDIFKIDIFDSSREILEKLSGEKYGENENKTYAFRVIMDHLRASVMMISDGIFPSNKDQGYVLRRLIRRSIRFARNLNIEGAGLMEPIADAVIDSLKDQYPVLTEKRNDIVDELVKEASKFENTLQKGLREVQKMWDKNNAISGKDAFDLYQTYGFPLELTEEIAQEYGQAVDRDAFKQEFENHKNLSRSASTQKFAGGLADNSVETTKLHTATHLLHQALRDVLGDHVMQKGSNITQERLRFDFSHTEKMTDEEKKKVEEIVNEQIQKKLPVSYELLTVKEAKEKGAIGLFEDKYAQLGGKIKVYIMGGYSKEICGGPHVQNTGDLGAFKIKKEEASSAGVRRIKAILGSE